jgi:hypothetical protein
MSIGFADFRVEVLLSFQRALWDQVTPDLRAVAIHLPYPLIRARFLYEVVGTDQEMIVAEVAAYVIADFVPPVDVDFSASGVPVGSPRVLEPNEEWLYRRREGS